MLTRLSCTLPKLQILTYLNSKDKRILIYILKNLKEIIIITSNSTNDTPTLKITDINFTISITETKVINKVLICAT